MNTALQSFTDQQGFATAGILATSAHLHSSTSAPRQVRHVKAHPERDPTRMAHLTPLDEAIFLADAVAGNSRAYLNKRYINHVQHQIVLEDILLELIPPQTWHLRRHDDLSTPVLDLP